MTLLAVIYLCMTWLPLNVIAESLSYWSVPVLGHAEVHMNKRQEFTRRMHGLKKEA